MKTIKLKAQLNLKDGTIIPVGAAIQFKAHGEVPSCGIFDYMGKELKLRYRSILKQPSINTVQKWSDNGVCKSVFGARVEPDGTGPDGEPSWMLAMGMI